MLRSETPNDNFNWDLIWKLHCTQRIRIFLWRLILNKLAIAQQLCRRGIGTEFSCTACGSLNEDADHLFRRCYYSSEIWKQLLPFDQQQDFDRPSWVVWISSNLQKKRIVHGVAWNLIFAASLWWIWRWRNDRCYGESRDPILHDTVSFIVNYARDMENAWGKNMMITTGRQQRLIDVCWIKPQDGWKLNVDGCAKGNPGLAAAGGLIRNDQGDWVLGFNCNLGIADSTNAEVFAIWMGLRRLVQMRVTRAEIETDSQMLVQMLRNNTSNNSPWRPWVEDCRLILQQNPHFRVHHIYREANKCADLLANFGLDQTLGEHYMDQPPGFLQTQLEKDKRGEPSSRTINGF